MPGTWRSAAGWWVVGIPGSDPLTPCATVHLKQELEELLQRPIDLVRLRERMNPALRQAILWEGHQCMSGLSAWC
jgi:hypothetical protein